MPELPEVEVTCRNVARWLEGRRLARLDVLDEAALKAGDPAAVAGVVIGRPHRRAKLCLVPLGEHVLVVHLRMTGKLVRGAPGRRPPRLRLIPESGPTVVFEDVRRLGQAWLLPATTLPAFLERHAPGAEPWPGRSGGAWLAEALQGKRGPIKPALMDNKRVSGIGNIGASEACWRAGVSPERPVQGISRDEFGRISDGVRGWIEDTIAAEDGEEIVYLQHGGDNPFHVYGRAGEPCPRCGAPIQRTTQSGRATFSCGGCQA
jgi:formamidopyrimidine-DNA glycosylase